MPDDHYADLKKELSYVLQKSADAFEKQLSYISSGSIGVSMLLIEQMFEDFSVTKGKWMVITGWILLVAVLVLNLFSHLIAAKGHYKTLEEIAQDKFSYKKANDRFKINRAVNWTTAAMLGLGILFIIIFISKNL